MHNTVVLLALLLAACAHDPLVDRLNVSDGKYDSDLAACKQGSSGLGVDLGLSNPLADCMKKKGYRVLLNK